MEKELANPCHLKLTADSELAKFYPLAPSAFSQSNTRVCLALFAQPFTRGIRRMAKCAETTVSGI